jgi:hypothetical protein
MDSTILAAIIGGLCTIGASLGTLLLTHMMNKNPLYERNKRQISLGGHWEGTAHQELGPEGVPMDLQMAITLKSTRQAVLGEGDIRFPFQNQPITEHLSLINGGFIYDRFLKIEYEGKNIPEQVQFGFLLLELSSNGQTLNGHFLGFGSFSGKIAWGTVQLHRSGITRNSGAVQTTI